MVMLALMRVRFCEIIVVHHAMLVMFASFLPLVDKKQSIKVNVLVGGRIYNMFMKVMNGNLLFSLLLNPRPRSWQNVKFPALLYIC